MTKSSVDLKVVVLGDASVGKTSVINRYCNDHFSTDTLATIGAGFFTHQVATPTGDVTLMVWDTAGEERFRSVTPSLLRGASGLVLVYDMQNRESFNSLYTYLGMFLDVVNVTMMPVKPVLLLGNKADLGPSVVPANAVETWAKDNEVEMKFDVSAKTGENVNDAFMELVDVIVRSGVTPPAQVKLPKINDDEGQQKCC